MYIQRANQPHTRAPFTRDDTTTTTADRQIRRKTEASYYYYYYYYYYYGLSVKTIGFTLWFMSFPSASQLVDVNGHTGLTNSCVSSHLSISSALGGPG